jgi:hypothetical protein
VEASTLVRQIRSTRELTNGLGRRADTESERRNMAISRGASHGASRTRTGDLLGAMARIARELRDALRSDRLNPYTASAVSA